VNKGASFYFTLPHHSYVSPLRDARDQERRRLPLFFWRRA
jgi:hypothetical protein